MSTNIKPLVVFGHWGGPNPWKVAIILKELNIPYEWKVIEFSDVKKDEYTNINPNGRLPTIQDPNTNVTLWETGAIIPYLIENYDKDGKISYTSTPERYLTQQWLMFQVSGQGPYFGQATWFARFHPEKIQSAIDRYVGEMIRTISVIDRALQGREWLVGDKCTYADLSFVTWSEVGKGLLLQLGRGSSLDAYPNYSRWMQSMKERESVKESLTIIAEERKAHGLP